MSYENLRDTIETHANVNGHSLSTLTVMSTITDPYRIDTPANRRDAEWLAQAWQSCGARRPIHLRGLHYALVSTPHLAPMPDGTPFLNTWDCWLWLQAIANRARWLGIVAFEDIVDERNAPPQIYTQPAEDGCLEVRVDNDRVKLWAPTTIKAMLPTVGATVQAARQAYRLVFIGEKQSLSDVLLTIAIGYHAELVLPTGELSTTLLYGIAKRAAADGRPVRIFYFADFDPTGFHMPVEVSRKLQALVDQFFPLLGDVQLRRCALTADQVKALGLPSTPMKETERRADRWRERFGVEQTEIDALATLRPRELRRIVKAAIAPYFDHSLQIRTTDAMREVREVAEAMLDSVLEDHRDRISDAEVALARARAAIVDAESIILPVIADIAADAEAAIDEINVDAPEPAPEGDIDAPLFCSAREWIAQTEILRKEKL